MKSLLVAMILAALANVVIIGSAYATEAQTDCSAESDISRSSLEVAGDGTDGGDDTVRINS